MATPRSVAMWRAVDGAPALDGTVDAGAGVVTVGPVGVALAELVERARAARDAFLLAVARPTVAVTAPPLATVGAVDDLTAALAVALEPAHLLYSANSIDRVVVLPGASAQEAALLMGRTVEGGAPPFGWASVRFPGDGETPARLIRVALRRLAQSPTVALGTVSGSRPRRQGRAARSAKVAAVAPNDRPTGAAHSGVAAVWASVTVMGGVLAGVAVLDGHGADPGLLTSPSIGAASGGPAPGFGATPRGAATASGTSPSTLRLAAASGTPGHGPAQALGTAAAVSGAGVSSTTGTTIAGSASPGTGGVVRPPTGSGGGTAGSGISAAPGSGASGTGTKPGGSTSAGTTKGGSGGGGSSSGVTTSAGGTSGSEGTKTGSGGTRSGSGSASGGGSTGATSTSSASSSGSAGTSSGSSGAASSPQSGGSPSAAPSGGTSSGSSSAGSSSGSSSSGTGTTTPAGSPSTGAAGSSGGSTGGSSSGGSGGSAPSGPSGSGSPSSGSGGGTSGVVGGLPVVGGVLGGTLSGLGL